VRVCVCVLVSDPQVGRQGVVTMEESKTAEDSLVFVEGMQFDRGYYSPYFVTDPERMVGRGQGTGTGVRGRPPLLRVCTVMVCFWGGNLGLKPLLHLLAHVVRAR
jgi:hypothetical protein